MGHACDKYGCPIANESIYLFCYFEESVTKQGESNRINPILNTNFKSHTFTCGIIPTDMTLYSLEAWTPLIPSMKSRISLFLPIGKIASGYW